MTTKTDDGRDPEDRRRVLKKAYWSTTVTSGDISLYAWENLDRRGLVYVKYVADGSTAKDGRRKRMLPGRYTVRNDRGRIDPEKVKDVEDALERAAARLVLGEDPFSEPERDEPSADVLTVRSTFRLALDVEEGKYASKTRRHDEVARARTKLERILGANTPIAEALAAPKVRGVWRKLAREYAESSQPRGKKCGARQTEVTIDALYTVGDWLVDEGRLPSESFKRIRFWREKLKEDWRQITGEEPETPDEEKPRHSEAEMRQLFGVLDDPRRRLFRVLRRRIPEGALTLARWSGLAFDDANAPVSLTVHWMRRVRTPGVKKADWASRPASQTFVLEGRERELVTDAIRGYLGLLEGARSRGSIEDYHLFPEGPLIDGRLAPSVTTPLSLDGDSVLALDERFELAFEIGGEQRMGQVIRTMRRKLTLPGIDRWANERTSRFGVLVPPPARKKETHPIALTQPQQEWFLEALERGYLREYEAAFRAGRIADYPLFVAERMPRGVAALRDDAKPLSRDAALKMFHHLEAIAGVEQVRGRGWYGVRRVAADVVEDVESDERVQDLVLANTKGTRRSHYQEKRRPKNLARASEARIKMRAGDTPPPPEPAEPSREAVLTALRAAGITLSVDDEAALHSLLRRRTPAETGTESR